MSVEAICEFEKSQADVEEHCYSGVCPSLFLHPFKSSAQVIFIARMLSLQLCLTLCDPMDCSAPGSSAMGFSRQEQQSGLPCSTLGELPDPGIKSASPAPPALQADSLLLSHWGSPYVH